jgi:hypothetical protein
MDVTISHYTPLGGKKKTCKFATSSKSFSRNGRDGLYLVITVGLTGLDWSP